MKFRGNLLFSTCFFFFFYLIYASSRSNHAMHLLLIGIVIFDLLKLIRYTNENGTFSLKSPTNDRILRNVSWQIYLLSDFLLEIWWERKSYNFIFSFWWLTWSLNSGLTSKEETYYLLDYGNFQWNTKTKIQMIWAQTTTNSFDIWIEYFG